LRNIKPARKYSAIFAGRNKHVAQVVSRGLSDDEVEANCNLIAAAPDLLAVLKEACKHTSINRNGMTSDLHVPYSIVEQMQAAIAKAERDS